MACTLRTASATGASVSSRAWSGRRSVLAGGRVPSRTVPAI